MRSDEVGVPPLAFVQLLNSNTLDAGSVAHFRRIIARQFASETELVERNVQVPIRWFREVYPDLDTDNATLLGVAFAKQAQLTSFGPLSLPLVSSSSVSEIFELLGYLPVISTALRPHFHHNERGLTVGLSGHTGDPSLDCFVIAYAGSALLRLLDMLAGTLPTVTLKLGWPAPRSQPRPESAFGARLIFDSPASFVDVPGDILDTPCRFADPVAYRLAINELRRTLDRRSTANSVTESVRRLLEQDPERHLGREVAELLSLSPSTLKRRLKDEGTTFRDVRQSLLRERAILRLLDRSMSVSQIAADLGYGDLTNFSHAFKRWTGQSPSEFRSVGGLERDE
ncbi:MULTISPECIES: helix-turn-helix domain-containing protein [Nocardioides]|uniref:Helix-turn-helix domain-containing protein n=1 Tax=Nocardioides kribbensis TaxID=305517 RepID=A0ABV1P3Q8_9ACTN|nr:AraC family transcriptional regulator [Nocardioides sp. CF8]